MCVNRYTFGQPLKGRVSIDVDIVPAWCLGLPMYGGPGLGPWRRFTRSSPPLRLGCSLSDPLTGVRCGGDSQNCREDPENPGVPVCVPEPRCPSLGYRQEVRNTQHVTAITTTRRCWHRHLFLSCKRAPISIFAIAQSIFRIPE